MEKHERLYGRFKKCLERHEWVKHGICSLMDAPAYFEWSLAKAKEISEAVAPYVDRKFSRKQFNMLVAYKLSDIDGAVRLKCSGQNLLSLSVFYKWGDTPQEVISTQAEKIRSAIARKHFAYRPNNSEGNFGRVKLLQDQWGLTPLIVGDKIRQFIQELADRSQSGSSLVASFKCYSPMPRAE